jgi:hypothetical protein
MTRTRIHRDRASRTREDAHPPLPIDPRDPDVLRAKRIRPRESAHGEIQPAR